VNGGTKLQELPEIKNCVRGGLRASLFLLSQSKEAAKKTNALRLGALPAVDRLCLSTFFTHKGKKQSSQLKPLRLCAFARVFFSR
jgi:hypothetical protein